MKAYLEIELIGEDVRQLNKAYERIGNEVKQSSERYFCIIDDDGNILAELFSDAEFSEAWEGEGDER
jgi:hypothetical protein